MLKDCGSYLFLGRSVVDVRSGLKTELCTEVLNAADSLSFCLDGSLCVLWIQVTDTQEDKFRRAAADSLLMRSGMTLERPEDGARSLMGMSIRDLAIECLQRDGSMRFLDEPLCK